MDFALKQKLASVEADLVSASAYGEKALLATIQQKIAAMDMTPEERFAVLDMLTNERQAKEAEAINGGTVKEGNLSKAVALGTIAAGVGAPLVRSFAAKRAKDKGWEDLHITAPDVIQADPVRAEAMYDMLHSTAPSLATNSVVAGDLMRQMTSMPMVDMGTVSSLAGTGKNMQQPPSGSGVITPQVVDDLVSSPGKISSCLDAMLSSEQRGIQVPVAHVNADGVPCAFNWATEAMKEAGITDAFSGGGTVMDQADNAFNMNEQQKGLSMLPLDSVVRELLSKEQELMQREDVLAQQEQQIQQAMQQVQQMQGMYQDQYGVSPQGEMMPEEQPMDPAAGAPPEGGMPPEEGMDPAMGGEEMPPEGEEEMPPEEGMDPAMMGEEEMPPEGEEDAAGGIPQEALLAAGEEGEEEELPPEMMEGEEGAPAEGEEELPPEMMEGEEEGVPAEDTDGSEGPGLPAEGAGEFPLEATDDDQGEGQPVDGDDDGLVNEGEEDEGLDDDAVPGAIDGDDDGVVLEGEEGEGADEDGVPGGEQEALMGEDPTVGGTEEADASGMPPEMGEGEITPAPEEAPMDPAMDPMAGGMPPEEPPMEPAMDPAAALGQPPMDPAAGAVPSPDGGMEMTIPLPSIHVSIKMAEEEEDKMASARKSFESTIKDLFRP